MHGLDAELWVIGERWHPITAKTGAVFLGVWPLAIGCGGWVIARMCRIAGGGGYFRAAVTFRGLPMSVIEAMLSGLRWCDGDKRPWEQVIEGETGFLCRRCGCRSWPCITQAGRGCRVAGGAWRSRPARALDRYDEGRLSTAPWTCSACDAIPPPHDRHCCHSPCLDLGVRQDWPVDSVGRWPPAVLKSCHGWFGEGAARG